MKYSNVKSSFATEGAKMIDGGIVSKRAGAKMIDDDIASNPASVVSPKSIDDDIGPKCMVGPKVL